MSTNFTTDKNEWLQTIQSFNSENDITVQLENISNINLISGFILDNTKPIIVNNKEWSIDSFCVPSIEEVNKLIKDVTDVGHTVYIHSLTKSKQKDTTSLNLSAMNTLREQVRDLSNSPEIIEQARAEIDQIVQNLPEIDSVILKAALPF